MSTFAFKHFSIAQEATTMKVGTDAMLLGSLIDVAAKISGLDIGSGTGILSLMLAQRNQQIKIDAIEIDQLAAEESARNFTSSPWSTRLHQIKVDFLELTSTKQYDLIFSNPPYYQTSLLNVDDRKARARHEAFLPMEMLVAKTVSLLAPTGNFWIIVPSENVDNWIYCCEKSDLSLVHKIQVIGKEGGAVKRIILNFSRVPKLLTMTEIAIRDRENNYTEQYIDLTKEYHAVDLRAD